MVLFFLQAKINIYGGGAIGYTSSRRYNSILKKKGEIPHPHDDTRFKSSSKSHWLLIPHLGFSYIEDEFIINSQIVGTYNFLGKDTPFNLQWLGGLQVGMLYRFTRRFATGILAGYEHQAIQSTTYEFHFKDSTQIGALTGKNTSLIENMTLGLQIKYDLTSYSTLVVQAQMLFGLRTQLKNEPIVSNQLSKTRLGNTNKVARPIRESYNHKRILFGLEFNKEIL